MRPTNEIFFAHIRRPDDLDPTKHSGKGGATVAFTLTADGVKYAIAKCHNVDNFNRKSGRVKAKGRLNSPRYAKELQIDTTNLNPAEVSSLICSQVTKLFVSFDDPVIAPRDYRNRKSAIADKQTRKLIA